MNSRMCLFELVNESGRDDKHRWFFLIELGYRHMKEVSSSFQMDPAFVGISSEQIFIKL